MQMWHTLSIAQHIKTFIQAEPNNGLERLLKETSTIQGLQTRSTIIQILSLSLMLIRAFGE